MERHGNEVAAVVTEPIMANQGCFMPDAGWLELLQSQTQQAGGLFIMDEVVTGFRVAFGGVQELHQACRRIFRCSARRWPAAHRWG